MLKGAGIILAVFVIFLLYTSVCAQPSGSLDIPFGLYKDSVKSMLERRGCVVSFESNGYYDHFYMSYQGYAHAGAQCGLFLTFYKNKLAGFLITDYNPKGGAKSRFKQLQKTLTSQYGHVVDRSHTADRSTLSWLLKAGESPMQLKLISVEMVRNEHKETEILERYVDAEEYEWEQKNPEHKSD